MRYVAFVVCFLFSSSAYGAIEELTLDLKLLPFVAERQAIQEAEKPDTLSLFVPLMPETKFVLARDFLGNLSHNPYNPNSTSNPYGKGSPYNPDSINNSYGKYGSPYSSYSANNPYATRAPKLYDQQGNYRGKLSSNPYDPDSISNPYGRYGSPYSPDSINNPYGAGSPYRSDSPNNPYGTGWSIFGGE